MADIRVTGIGEDQYRVEVREGDTSTTHLVTAHPSDVDRLGGGVRPEELIEASFEYLLEHEPKESILSRFDLTVIATYFPAYPSEIAHKLS